MKPKRRGQIWRCSIPGVSLALVVWAIQSMEWSVFCAAARVPWTTSHVIGSPNPPAPYNAERRFPALSFQHPVDLALMPGSARFFILEQGGKLSSFLGHNNSQSTDLVFDFS